MDDFKPKSDIVSTGVGSLFQKTNNDRNAPEVPKPIEYNPEEANKEEEQEPADKRIKAMRKRLTDARSMQKDGSGNGLCKSCGKPEDLCKCVIKAELQPGMSYKELHKLEKARADEGKSLTDKVRARQERNDRDVKSTMATDLKPSRTVRSYRRRVGELEAGINAKYDKYGKDGKPMRVSGVPAERRPGEKIIGTPKEQDETSGVHIRQATYAPKERNKAGDGATGSMSEHGGAKSYRSGGKYHSYGGEYMAHQDVMNGLKRTPKMKKSEVEDLIKDVQNAIAHMKSIRRGE